MKRIILLIALMFCGVATQAQTASRLQSNRNGAPTGPCLAGLNFVSVQANGTTFEVYNGRGNPCVWVPIGQPPPYAIASFPTATAGRIVLATDGSSATDCTSGGGSDKHLCFYNGSAWAAVGGSGGGGGGITNSALIHQVMISDGTNAVGDSDLTFLTDTLTATKVVASTNLKIGAGSVITSSGAGGALGTNAFNSTAYVPTSTTVNGKALSGNITLGLASADFANQGTTTTVLHGNAAGNPSFGAVSLTADVTGVTPVANGGTALSSFTAHNVLTGGSAGTALGSVAPGTTGNVLTSNGTDWTSATPAGASIAPLVVENANTVGQQNGSNAQTFKLYANSNDILYFSYGLIAGGRFEIFSSVGAGTPKDLAIGSGGNNLIFLTGNANRARFDSSGNFIFENDNANDIGASGANRPRTLYLGTTDSSSSTTGALVVAGGGAIAKRVFIPGITGSAGLQTAVLCQSSGGEMIADSIACLASSSRFKNNIMPLRSGLDEIMRFRPVSFTYKPEGIFASNKNFAGERVGLIAEEVSKIDPRLVGFEKDGITPRTVGYEQIVPIVIKAMQEQQAQFLAFQASVNAKIEGLIAQHRADQRTIHRLRHRR